MKGALVALTLFAMTGATLLTTDTAEARHRGGCGCHGSARHARREARQARRHCGCHGQVQAPVCGCAGGHASYGSTGAGYAYVESEGNYVYASYDGPAQPVSDGYCDVNGNCH